MSTGELAALASIDVDIDPTLTGFSTGEIDVILASACDPDDEIIPQVPATSKTRPGDIWILGEHRVRCPEGPRHLGLKPVSADIRTSLCSRAEIPPGKSLARPETEAAFFVTPSDSGRQRPRHAASPTAKPPESQRLFRRRQETGIAQDCVVDPGGLEPAAERLWAWIGNVQRQ
jgi:hypothetical protein